MSLSPSHSDVYESPLQQTLPTSPVSVNYIFDLPESPKSHSSATNDSSTSLDSPTVTPTDESANSSTLSQPELTSTPVKCHPEPNTTSLSPARPIQPAGPVPGIKLILDNIDKTVKRRHQTIDAQSKSLHYVQVYAVKDRVDFSQLSNTAPSPGRSVYEILPTTSDYQTLKDNFAILVARILTKHIPYFKQDFSGLVVNNIPHKYSSEMANKSEVVSYYDIIL